MRVLAIAVGALVVLLAVAQIVLPRIAASQIGSRIGRYGHVRSVSVSAWPAVELLWGRAGSVSVSASHLSLTPAQAASLLWESKGVGRLDVSVRSVHVGGLALSGATLRKRGAQLEAHAQTTQTAADAALGAGIGVRLLGSAEGRVRVRVGGSLFGVGASVPAVAEAVDGALVAHPEGFLIEGFKLTLFSDPHVHVEGVEATPAGEAAYTLGMRALLG